MARTVASIVRIVIRRLRRVSGMMKIVTCMQDSKKYANTTSFVVTAVTTNLVVTVLLL